MTVNLALTDSSATVDGLASVHSPRAGAESEPAAMTCREHRHRGRYWTLTV